jgi:hypothetical protein
MNETTALTISIGVLGAIDTFLTATVLPVPVWVTFIAWASFFFLGGGAGGWVRSVASNLAGIVIASVTLLIIAVGPNMPIFAAILVGLGSAAMVQASRLQLLSKTPAIVLGFASLVGTTAATGVGVTEMGMTHPTLVAAVAMVVGGSFGFVSEQFAKLMTAKPEAASEAETV